MIRVGAPVLAEAHLGGGQPYIAGKFTGDGFHRHTHFGSSQALPFAPAINSAPRILARPAGRNVIHDRWRSEEHTSELQSRGHLVCRLLLEKKKHTRHRRNGATDPSALTNGCTLYT